MCLGLEGRGLSKFPVTSAYGKGFIGDKPDQAASPPATKQEQGLSPADGSIRENDASDSPDAGGPE